MLLRAAIISLLIHGLLFVVGSSTLDTPVNVSAVNNGAVLVSVLRGVPANDRMDRKPLAEPKVRRERPLLTQADAQSRVRERAVNPSLPTPSENFAVDRPSTAKIQEELPGKGVGAPAPADSARKDVVADDDLRQYSLALAREARRFKRYPALARERGWEGVVTVTVRLGAHGRSEIVLGKSSGYEVLDLQAMDMIDKAAKVARVPEGLAGKTLSLNLPIRYALDE